MEHLNEIPFLKGIFESFFVSRGHLGFLSFLSENQTTFIHSSAGNRRESEDSPQAVDRARVDSSQLSIPAEIWEAGPTVVDLYSRPAITVCKANRGFVRPISSQVCDRFP